MKSKILTLLLVLGCCGFAFSQVDNEVLISNANAILAAECPPETGTPNPAPAVVDICSDGSNSMVYTVTDPTFNTTLPNSALIVEVTINGVSSLVIVEPPTSFDPDPTLYGAMPGDQISVVGATYDLAQINGLISTLANGFVCSFAGLDAATCAAIAALDAAGGISDLQGALNFAATLGVPAPTSIAEAYQLLVDLNTQADPLGGVCYGLSTPGGAADFTYNVVECVVCPVIQSVSAVPADGCDAEMVDVVVTYDQDPTGLVTVDVNGDAGVIDAAAFTITYSLTLANATCDPVMLDVVHAATCDEDGMPILDATGADTNGSLGMINVYPFYEVVVVQPECDGLAGSAEVQVAGTPCATPAAVAGTAGVTNVCPAPAPGTPATLVYDFSADANIVAATAAGCAPTGTLADDISIACDVDPCPAVCQGIDLGAGFPVIPTEVCSGATADICLTLIDATEGLVIIGSIDGAPVTLTGAAGAGANELCVTITAPVNETCAPVDVVIQIDAIQCTDGTDYPGLLGAPTLLEDLTNAGFNPIAIPVYPTLEVNATGDGMCGDLVAELVTTDGTPCATAVGSPFTCTADGEVLAYDFTGDPALAAFTAVPADCPLPVLSGNLACVGCTVLGCTDPCAPNYDPTAGEDDGTCMPYDMTCNADCTAGPFGGTWDAATCACINETAPVSGCTDATATNYNAAANCDDGSCIGVVLGCTDPCAPNYDPTAGEDDGTCMPYDMTCNADCTAGPFGGTWDAATCACINETAPVSGCTDPAAPNYDAAANCDDGSCQAPGAMATITDPCNCTNGIDLDGDTGNGLELAAETITITDPAGAGETWMLTTSNDLTLADGMTDVSGMATDNGDGTYTLSGFVLADGVTTYSATFTNTATGEVLMIAGGPCSPCPVNIPTVGQWGLIILGLLMSITAVVGIRQRREEEAYS